MPRRNERANPGSYQELRMWAEAFADAQEVRIAFENKERSGTVETEVFAATVKLYKQAEESLRREMVRCYRVTVPGRVRRWQEETAGIGESTLARLLGATGDPRTAFPRHWEGTGSERHLVDDPPLERGVGRLWQYCGHGAPKNRDVKGNAAALAANGSPDAKMLVRLLAQAQVKTNSKEPPPYRAVYDAEKAKYAQRVHSTECRGGYSGNLYVKCKTHGPEKGYAQAGDPYQPSHLHAIALRHTGKEILRDLWLTAGGDEPVFGTVRTGEENRGRHRSHYR